jgi:hypothetical protein
MLAEDTSQGLSFTSTWPWLVILSSPHYQDGIFPYVYENDTSLYAANALFHLWLYKLDPLGLYQIVDSGIVYRGGGSCFLQPHGFGTFLTLVVPDTPVGIYVPTYAYNYTHWADADNNQALHVSALTQPDGTIPIPIAMQRTSNATGQASISGHIASGIPKTSALNDPVPNIGIVLTDAQGKTMRYKTTDAQGNFTMDSLPYGTYTVTPDRINFRATPYTVTLSPQQPSFTTATWTMGARTFATTVASVSAASLGLTAYPVPATDALTVRMATPEHATLTLLDITGRSVRTQAATGLQSTLPVAGLAPGIYTLQVTSETKGSASLRVIVQ